MWTEILFIKHIYQLKLILIKINKFYAVFFFKIKIAVVIKTIKRRSIGSRHRDDHIICPFNGMQEFKNAFKGAGMCGGELIVNGYIVGLMTTGLSPIAFLICSAKGFNASKAISARSSPVERLTFDLLIIPDLEVLPKTVLMGSVIAIPPNKEAFRK